MRTHLYDSDARADYRDMLRDLEFADRHLAPDPYDELPAPRIRPSTVTTQAGPDDDPWPKPGPDTPF